MTRPAKREKGKVSTKPIGGVAGVMRITKYAERGGGPGCRFFANHKMKPGWAKVVLVLGVEHEDGDEIDPRRVLNDHGWTYAKPAPAKKRLKGPR